MKAVLALLVMVLAPLHVTLGPVSLPISWLLAAAEVLLASGGIWLIVRIVREARSAWIAGGAW